LYPSSCVGVLNASPEWPKLVKSPPSWLDRKKVVKILKKSFLCSVNTQHKLDIKPSSFKTNFLWHVLLIEIIKSFFTQKNHLLLISTWLIESKIDCKTKKSLILVDKNLPLLQIKFISYFLIHQSNFHTCLSVDKVLIGTNWSLPTLESFFLLLCKPVSYYMLKWKWFLSAIWSE